MLQAVQPIDSGSPMIACGPHALEGPYDDVLYLLGRPALGDDIGFLSTQVVDPPEMEELTAAWRESNDVVQRLQSEEAGLADSPVFGDLHPDMLPARDRLLRSEKFRRALAVVPHDVKMVDLAKLVVPQKQVTLPNVRRIQSGIGPSPEPRALFDLCQPLDQPRDPVRCLQSGADSYVFVSPSHDLRFIEPVLLDAESVQAQAPRGVAAAAIGLIIGYSVNCLMATHVGNRLVLINGTHRAYALLEMGITHAPAVIHTVTRPEELAVVAPREVLACAEQFLNIPRPIVLKDYLDPRLHRRVQVVRRVRQVKVRFAVETFDTPITS